MADRIVRAVDGPSKGSVIRVPDGRNEIACVACYLPLHNGVSVPFTEHLYRVDVTPGPDGVYPARLVEADRG